MFLNGVRLLVHRAWTIQVEAVLVSTFTCVIMALLRMASHLQVCDSLFIM
jgi:hypothetical protein